METNDNMSFSNEINSLLWVALLLLLPLLVGLFTSKTHQPGTAQMAHAGNLAVRVRGILDKQRQRGASKWQRFIGLALIIALILPLVSQIEQRTLPPKPVLAQGDITLTVAVQEQGMSFFPANAFDQFEATYGVNVELVRDDAAQVGLPSHDPTPFLDGVADYADGADVLFHHYHSYLNPISTRAGYFLDLAPLAATDPNFNESVYFPAALDAYRWDNGLWALPLSVEPLVVIYDQTAFEAAGLTYPDETWTLDQFVNAARELAVTEPDGTISRAGLVGDPMPLFRALLNRSITPPFASDAELMALWQTWADLEAEGIVAAYDSGDGTTPLQLAGTWRLFSMMPGATEHWAASRLPNGTGALGTNSGFVVSAGTAHPELAFALAQYLSSLSGLSTVMSAASLPAQPALIGLQETVIPQMVITGKTPEIAEFERTVIESVPPATDNSYKDFFWEAIVQVGEMGLAPDAALLQVDSNIANALTVAQARRDAGVVIHIAPPPQPIEAPDGEVVVRFHLSQVEERVINFDQWQRVAQEFAAQDPEVFAVELLTGESMREGEADCYIGNVFNPAVYDQNYLLNLDPLMQADPNFDSRDFIPGALEGVQYNGQTWAYPLAAQPTVLWVEENLFAQAGLTVPPGEWTIDEFMDALYQIQGAGVEVEYPFVPSFDAADLLVLAAAFGGLPVDFTTSPATVNLTDPTNLAAIQQVLDLAKDGLMMYREPYSFGGASGAIIADSLMNLPSYMMFREMGGGPAHRMVNFPKGSQYTPVSYEMLGGYILRESPNPEACYRWIAYAAQHPEVLAGASTRLSQADNPLTETAFGPDIAATYRAFHRMMQDPNLVAMPMLGMSGTDVLATAETMWINEAFTIYVQDPNTDLGTVLAQAQQRVEEYRACMVDHPRPVYEADPMVWQVYDTKLQECAVAIDPDIMSKPPFSMMYGGN